MIGYYLPKSHSSVGGQVWANNKVMLVKDAANGC